MGKCHTSLRNVLLEDNSMRKKFVYICSPLSGDIEKNIIKAQSYCRNIAEAFPNVVPIAPHISTICFVSAMFSSKDLVEPSIIIPLAPSFNALTTSDSDGP